MARATRRVRGSLTERASSEDPQGTPGGAVSASGCRCASSGRDGSTFVSGTASEGRVRGADIHSRCQIGMPSLSLQWERPGRKGRHRRLHSTESGTQENEISGQARVLSLAHRSTWPLTIHRHRNLDSRRKRGRKQLFVVERFAHLLMSLVSQKPSVWSCAPCRTLSYDGRHATGKLRPTAAVLGSPEMRVSREITRTKGAVRSRVLNTDGRREGETAALDRHSVITDRFSH
jgi:hypothetical protein